MQQILKRLDLIKTAIAIEDQEIIELQHSKLSTMEIDDSVRMILERLSNNDYASAVIEIESYINRFSGVVVYEDKEIGALKMELKVLEKKLQELSEEKNEYLNELNEFNTQYNIHLGEVIKKILELKKEILYRKTIEKQTLLDDSKAQLDDLKDSDGSSEKELDGMDVLDDDYDEIFEQLKNLKEAYKEKLDELNSLQDELQNDEDVKQYEEAKDDYRTFSDYYDEIIKEERFELDEDELKELKQAYRKASKLCHPDLVHDELQEQALKLMQELNEAYGKKDLKKVHQILTMLENGGGFDIASDAINDKELLRTKIEALRVKIDKIMNEIDEITSDETFTIIQELDDWDNYFNTLKADLNEEKEHLEAQINAIDHEEKEIAIDPIKSNEDEYWNEKF